MAAAHVYQASPLPMDHLSGDMSCEGVKDWCVRSAPNSPTPTNSTTHTGDESGSATHDATHGKNHAAAQSSNGEAQSKIRPKLTAAHKQRLYRERKQERIEQDRRELQLLRSLNQRLVYENEQLEKDRRQLQRELESARQTAAQLTVHLQKYRQVGSMSMDFPRPMPALPLAESDEEPMELSNDGVRCQGPSRYVKNGILTNFPGSENLALRSGFNCSEIGAAGQQSFIGQIPHRPGLHDFSSTLPTFRHHSGPLPRRGEEMYPDLAVHPSRDGMHFYGEEGLQCTSSGSLLRIRKNRHCCGPGSIDLASLQRCRSVAPPPCGGGAPMQLLQESPYNDASFIGDNDGAEVAEPGWVPPFFTAQNVVPSPLVATGDNRKNWNSRTAALMDGAVPLLNATSESSLYQERSERLAVEHRSTSDIEQRNPIWRPHAS